MKYVVKLGGSLVTHKSNEVFPKTAEEVIDNPDKYLRLDIMKQAAKSIKAAKQEISDLELVLITGAGCCGHPQVHRGFQPEAIHRIACMPAVYLQKMLFEQRLQSNLVSPYISATCQESEKYGGIKYDIDNLWRALQKPDSDVLKITWYARISHGDVVPMAKGKKGRLGDYEVISGDNLVVDIGEMWLADQVIMVSDVDGMYTTDPKSDELAEKINKVIIREKADDDEQFRNAMARDYNVKFVDVKDVTRGFFGKIGKLYRFTYKTGIKSQAIGIDGLEAALKGKNPGTLIEKA